MDIWIVFNLAILSRDAIDLTIHAFWWTCALVFIGYRLLLSVRTAFPCAQQGKCRHRESWGECGFSSYAFLSQLLSSASLAVQCLEIVVLYILSSFHSCSWLELKVLSYSLIDLDITSSEKTFTKLDSSCLCRCFSSWNQGCNPWHLVDVHKNVLWKTEIIIWNSLDQPRHKMHSVHILCMMWEGFKVKWNWLFWDRICFDQYLFIRHF